MKFLLLAFLCVDMSLVCSKELSQVDIAGGVIAVKSNHGKITDRVLVGDCLDRDAQSNKCKKVTILDCDDSTFCTKVHPNLMLNLADENDFQMSKANVYLSTERYLSYPFLGLPGMYLAIYFISDELAKDRKMSLGKKVVGYMTAGLLTPLDVAIFVGNKIVTFPLLPIRINELKKSMKILTDAEYKGKVKTYSLRKFRRVRQMLETIADEKSQSPTQRFLGWQ